MKSNSSKLLVIICLISAFFCFDQSIEAKEPPKDADIAEKTPPKPSEPEKESITDHHIVIDHKKLHYQAKAAEMIIELGDRKAKGRIFYVAYTMKNASQKDRPLTFAFNGGPGAASVWLHMGGLGPKRVVLNKDGTVPPPPGDYTTNPQTWLAFTDLVFVDPIGTGFSRAEPDEKEDDKAFMGVKQDVASIGEFIRMYLSRHHRWLSPLYLVGESYGSTRAAALTLHLWQDAGIALKGVVLISPVLSFNTIFSDTVNDLPYLMFLPTYAAISRFHQDVQSRKSENMSILAEAEAFCFKSYPAYLVQGSYIAKEDRDILERNLMRFTGLSKSLIVDHHYRIPSTLFSKNLLKKEGKIVGRMDGTITGVDPDPDIAYPTYDPSLDNLFGLFSSTVNAYLRQDLKYDSDAKYEFLNPFVNKNWDWSSGLKSQQGFVDVSKSLRKAIAVNDAMKVFIACGLFDQATPYFAAKHTVSHMWLGSQKNAVEIHTYAAGHMIFTHLDALIEMTSDVRKFYSD